MKKWSLVLVYVLIGGYDANAELEALKGSADAPKRIKALFGEHSCYVYQHLDVDFSKVINLAQVKEQSIRVTADLVSKDGSIKFINSEGADDHFYVRFVEPPNPNPYPILYFMDIGEKTFWAKAGGGVEDLRNFMVFMRYREGTFYFWCEG